MPAAKKAAPKKDIVKDPKQEALFKAIATGDTSAVDLDLVKELMDSLGLSVVAKGVSAARGSRVEKRRHWMTATEMTEEEIQTIKDLPEVVGKAPILTEEDNRALTHAELVEWMDETLKERDAEDILKGRHEARRATLFNHASFLNDGDPYATGTYAVPELGHKFNIIKQERSGQPDMSKLEEVLAGQFAAENICGNCGSDIKAGYDEGTWVHSDGRRKDDPSPTVTVWQSITDEVTVRQVNEGKLSEAVSTGEIALDKFAEVVPAPTIVRVLRVDPLKEGDAI